MDTIPEQQPATSVIKPRNAWIAFILSFFVPGLGQVYNGQWKKGLLFFVVIYCVRFFLEIPEAITSFYSLLTLCSIEFVLRIFIIVDAIRYARRQKGYIPKKYNKWYYHLLIAAAMIAVLTSYNRCLQTYKVTSTSGYPTTQLDDRLAVDLSAYKNKEADYGDIVAFNAPNGKVWAYRVVGLPGDSLELTNDLVSIKGKTCNALLIKNSVIEQVPVDEYAETLPNGFQYHIAIARFLIDSSKTNIKNIFVPAGSYYLLADDRDNGSDSRYIGPVKQKNVLGRVIFSFWGKTTKRINIDFRASTSQYKHLK